MKFGLFTCGYQRGDIRAAFADAAEFGYDYVDIWGGRPHAYAPDVLSGGAARLRALAAEYGVPILVYTPEHNAYPYNYMLGDRRQWSECVDYLTLAMRAACELGAEYTLLSVGHGGAAPCAKRWERLAETLSVLAARAEELGQTLLLETLTAWESNTCTTLRELKRALDAVRSPALLGMCDLVAPYTQGEDPADYARELGGRMALLHLVDSDGRSESHLVPGDGVMDMKRVLADIRAAGFDGPATIELVTNYMDDPSGYARLALERARELL